MASQQEAKDAIYSAVVKMANKADQVSASVGAQILRDAGIAYRAVAGGAQVGGVFVDGK